MRKNLISGMRQTLGAVALMVSLASWSDAAEERLIQQGEAIYQRSCLVCHGIDGKGDGPAAYYNSAYSASRPRDFTVGNYKFRSTASGESPTAQDLFRILTNGIPGYMPSFSGLSEEARWQVIAYVQQFNQDPSMLHPEIINLQESEIPSSSASIEQGRSIYVTMECQACHGMDGRGTGATTQAQDLLDNRGLPIPSTDLTFPRSFKNGWTARDIVRTLLTGLDGTPMPSYQGQLQDREEDVWHLANYILSLSPRP